MVLLPIFFIDSDSYNAKQIFLKYYFFAGVTLFNRKTVSVLFFLLGRNNLSNIRKIGVFLSNNHLKCPISVFFSKVGFYRLEYVSQALDNNGEA